MQTFEQIECGAAGYNIEAERTGEAVSLAEVHRLFRATWHAFLGPAV